MTRSQFVIPGRFNGPPTTANGGFACGILAALAAPAYGPRVAVTLHTPPPLDVQLTLDVGPRRAHARHGEDLIATVSPDAADIPVVEPVAIEIAREAEHAFTGPHGHPFPACFVCGTDRAPGDGLRLRPGRVPGRDGMVACTWTPDESVAGLGGLVRPEAVWGVLDCPGGWTGDPVRETAVLGRMTARIEAAPRIGVPYVVIGRNDADDGHAAVNVTALYDLDGGLVGAASAVWMRLPVPVD